MALFGRQFEGTGRRFNDIDWLRVVATAAVFCLSCSRFFDYGSWHVKNATASPFFESVTVSLGLWVMPLFFVISGVSAALALQQRGPARFVRSRATRLLLPFAFGMLVLAPPQLYLEQVAHLQFSGSVLQFYPRYIDGVHGLGAGFAFTGTHLWYLLTLFLFSLLLVPLGLLLWSRTGRRVRQGMVSLFSRPVALLALALPLVALELGLPREGIGTHDFGGWSLAQYLVLFAYGYMLLAEERVRAAVRKVGPYALMLVLLAMPATVYAGAPRGASADSAECRALSTFTSWCSVLSLLYLAQCYLARGDAVLRWASPAVMPFYMLHQTVILGVGYGIVRSAAGDAMKYAMIWVVSLAIMVALYELAIRRVAPLRLLFGMKTGISEAPQTAALPASVG